MASIDKLHLTGDQAREFWLWSLDHKYKCEELTGELITKYFVCNSNGDYSISFPESIDWYLFKFCNLEFIQKRLSEQYDLKEDPPVNKMDIVVENILKMHNYDVEEARNFICYVANASYKTFNCAIKRLTKTV